MSTQFPRLERRRSVRSAPKGSVNITGPGWTYRGRILNAGTGGLLVAGVCAEATAGNAVDIELRLDAAEGEWLRVAGKVSRADDKGLALVFVDTPRALEDLLAKVSGDARMRDRRMSVILVDATQPRRDALAEAFRAAGCLVIEVETPLAAISALGSADFEPDLIAIADSSPGDISDELRNFVGDAHPNVKLVRIGDDLVGPVGLAHWLSTANPGDDLVARIRRLLGAQR